MDKSFLELFKMLSGFGNQNPFSQLFGQNNFYGQQGQNPYFGQQNQNNFNQQQNQGFYNQQSQSQNNGYQFDPRTYYPNEAYFAQNENNFQPNAGNMNNPFMNMFNQSQDNNLLPLLMSMLGKGNFPLAEIFAQTNNKVEKETKEESSSQQESFTPNDEILL